MSSSMSTNQIDIATLHLPHTPTTTVSLVALFDSVTDTSSLRGLLQPIPSATQGATVEVPLGDIALINADLITSSIHLSSTIFRALVTPIQRRKSRTLHTEIVFGLGTTNNIASTLKTFGVIGSDRFLSCEPGTSPQKSQALARPGGRIIVVKVIDLAASASTEPEPTDQVDQANVQMYDDERSHVSRLKGFDQTSNQDSGSKGTNIDHLSLDQKNLLQIHKDKMSQTLARLVQGRSVPFTDENIRKGTDWDLVRRVYKLNIPTNDNRKQQQKQQKQQQRSSRAGDGSEMNGRAKARERARLQQQQQQQREEHDESQKQIEKQEAIAAESHSSSSHQAKFNLADVSVDTTERGTEEDEEEEEKKEMEAIILGMMALRGNT